jgi:hypothetical protein
MATGDILYLWPATCNPQPATCNPQPATCKIALPLNKGYLENVEDSSTVISKYFDNSVKVVKCLDVATFSHMFHLEMSGLIFCVEIHTCLHAFICFLWIRGTNKKRRLYVFSHVYYLKTNYRTSNYTEYQTYKGMHACMNFNTGN